MFSSTSPPLPPLLLQPESVGQITLNSLYGLKIFQSVLSIRHMTKMVLNGRKRGRRR